MKPIASGFLRMMDHQGIDPVSYIWVTATYDSDSSEKQKPNIQENPNILNYLGKKIRLEFTGKIRCVSCGRITKKSFNQGNCFTCFQTLAENDLCILRPDTCHFHLGTCREPDWGETHCFISHTVYLANSSAIKVGITKENPVSNRWVDQGAVQGIPLVEVISRRDAGIIEKELSKILSDRTAWQKMVSGDPEPVDLVFKKKEFLKTIEELDLDLDYVISDQEDPTYIRYPIQSYPKKIQSLAPEKHPVIEDVLTGIKGQYLLFSSGVINIRAYGGYESILSSE
ncbi:MULTISPECIES: DUF2797 domain-containing protein [Leptospira]|uniref:DUF2797 domain-containing protein n=1 Tax=Leptospira TaxID=171 RepID=UPI0002BFDC7C|nr:MULTISPECIES: DUF2797 domain-containing protein [Leptospira]EMK05637.1 PF10977 family protein [Leptospira kirschneri]KXZ26141.1 hypothetical protein AYB32_17025 [Leptospira kirschneri]KXZ30525.1 hypothetical protein AYB34_16385 [Leptospira sp. ZV016]